MRAWSGPVSLLLTGCSYETMQFMGETINPSTPVATAQLTTTPLPNPNCARPGSSTAH